MFHILYTFVIINIKDLTKPMRMGQALASH